MKILIAVCVCLAATVARPQSITTTFATNGGGNVDWVNLFDVTVLHPNGLKVTSIDIHTRLTPGLTATCDFYVVSGGSYVGNETNPTAWTLVSTGTGRSNGFGVPTRIDCADFTLPPGPHGFAVHYRDCPPRYTNGTLTVGNPEVSLTLGVAVAGRFAGSVFQPRICNLTIYYFVGDATVRAFGAGCAGSAGTPDLTATPPQLGGALVVTLSNLPAAVPVFVVFGLDAQRWNGNLLPYDLAPIGAPGCEVLCDIEAYTATNSGVGTAVVTQSVPNDPSLSGAPLYLQGYALDPTANALQLTTSNAAETYLGR